MWGETTAGAKENPQRSFLVCLCDVINLAARGAAKQLHALGEIKTRRAATCSIYIGAARE
jgi:hypothetical protein